MGDAKMNKKGDVATIMLPIVALVMAIATLTAFVFFDRSIENKSLEISHVISEVEFDQSYVLSQAELIGQEVVNSKESDLRSSFVNIAAKKDIRVDNSGNFFGKIRSGEFSFIKNGENYVLKIDNLFVQAKRGENTIKRSFNLIVTFNKSGTIISKEVKFGVSQGL